MPSSGPWLPAHPRDKPGRRRPRCISLQLPSHSSRDEDHAKLDSLHQDHPYSRKLKMKGITKGELKVSDF